MYREIGREGEREGGREGEREREGERMQLLKFVYVSSRGRALEVKDIEK